MENENAEIPNNVKCVLVEIKELKKLLRQCHYCGHKIAEESLNCCLRGGVFFASFRCFQCQRKRFWRSFENPLNQLATGATFASGVGLAKILHFFAFFQCAFPSRRSVYYTAQHVIRPLICQYYNSERANIVNYILQLPNPVHLYFNGQFDLPGFSTCHRTVIAIESISKKIIGFMTVTQQEANNNKSANAESIAFRRFVNELLFLNIRIGSITTDNNISINEIMSNEFPDIVHYLDLWHILRNMYKTFQPKFNKVCFLLFLYFAFVIICIFFRNIQT